MLTEPDIRLEGIVRMENGKHRMDRRKILPSFHDVQKINFAKIEFFKNNVIILHTISQ